MTINIRIDDRFADNFSGYYPSITVEVPDHRFEDRKVKEAIEKKINEMLDVDVFRMNGRGVVRIEEDGTSYYARFTEEFELRIDFCEMTGKVIFKRSNRGSSRLI